MAGRLQRCRDSATASLFRLADPASDFPQSRPFPVHEQSGAVDASRDPDGDVTTSGEREQRQADLPRRKGHGAHPERHHDRRRERKPSEIHGEQALRIVEHRLQEHDADDEQEHDWHLCLLRFLLGAHRRADRGEQRRVERVAEHEEEHEQEALLPTDRRELNGHRGGAELLKQCDAVLRHEHGRGAPDQHLREPHGSDPEHLAGEQRRWPDARDDDLRDARLLLLDDAAQHVLSVDEDRDVEQHRHGDRDQHADLTRPARAPAP